MRILEKIQTLKPADFWVLLWASFALPIVGLRLRVMGFKKVFRWANERSNNVRLIETDATTQSAHLGKLINFVATHGWYNANCLSRSLVLLRIMRQKGLPGEFRIGIPKHSSEDPTDILQAHAWLEYQGVVINDHKDVANRHAVFNSDLQ